MRVSTASAVFAARSEEGLIRTAGRLLKKGVSRRCERRGAGCKEARRRRCRWHRRGAATPQTAPRRRNRLRWLAFCSPGFEAENLPSEENSLLTELQKARHDTRIHFSAAC